MRTNSDSNPPVLKVTEETIFHVNYNDLDRFLTAEYGHPFEFVAQEESSNDVSHEYNLKTAYWSEYWDKDLIVWKEKGEGMWMTARLLEDCARRGRIPRGLYVIKVSW